MEKFTLTDFRKMLQTAFLRISERADEFSRLDAVIGDGDHGTAIVQALSAAVDASANGTDLKTVLNDIGFHVMLQTSGSTSTLLGGFFLGMSDGVDDEELDADAIRKMFTSGLNGVRKQTKAQVGDKTMMDALIPAVEAMDHIRSADIKEVFRAAAMAAQEGAEATQAMKANFGRARNYGEKSIGYVDSGAASWACMFDAFAKAL